MRHRRSDRAPRPAPSATSVAGAWVDAWNSDNPARLGALFTEDATYRDLAVNKTSTGRDGVVDWKRRTNANVGGVHVTLEDAFGEGERVAVQAVYSGRLQGAPTPFRVPLLTVLTVRNGLIVDDADYYNLADVLRLSGLPPDWTPPPSR